MTQISARRLPVHRGPAAWNAILPDPGAAEALESDITADVVVIGAGFAGLSSARRLRQLDKGLSVVVLEAGRVAEGAAGRNSGFMIDLPHELTSEDYAGSGDDRAVIAMNRQAQAFGADAVSEYGINPAFFDPVGKVNGAASAATHAHNQSYAQHLETLGEASEMLDARQMTEMTGSQHYRSGLYTPGTVMLQPAGYIRGLAEGLRRDGVKVFENSAVTELTPGARGCKVQTAKGRIDCGKIVLAANGHLESFGFETGRLMQIFLFATMTPDLDATQLNALGGADRWGITPSDPMGTTMRRIDTAQGGNRIITRTCAVLRPGLQSTARDLARTKAVMRKKFDQRFPQLAGLAMEHAWAGHLCLSLNSVSVVKEVESGVFAACVQNGLGTARGTLTGMAAAELTLGAKSSLTAHFAAEARPKKLPPQPFRQIGANALLRWREWKARSE